MIKKEKIKEITLIVALGMILFQNSLINISPVKNSRIYYPKLIKFFPLDQKVEALGRVYDFSVDKNGYIYVPDSAFSNIKIFYPSGKLMRVVGRKGAGPSEFIDPVRISINGDRIVIQDVGQLKYIVLDKNFNEINRFFYLLSGQPFVLKGDKIIANEFYRRQDGKEFRGIILDLSGNILKGLIEQKRVRNAWEAIRDSMGFIDVSEEGDIFLVKSGRVYFYKFDRKGNFIKNFGIQPDYFIAPERTKDFEDMLKWGRAPQGRKAAQDWYRSSSWVSGIFVLKKLIGIPIRVYKFEENKWECFLQFYDFEGNLVEDGIRLPEVGSSSNTGFSVDSDHINNIYILEEIESEPLQYIFYHYTLKE